jgi:ferric-dicitrate binding protein FerR (iron transport regulator)
VGRVTLESDSGSSVFSPETPEAVYAGQTIGTGRDSGLALEWVNGTQVRIDQSTRLELVSASEFVLHSGSVYLDTQPAHGLKDSLAVRTSQGLVEHQGTQFITRVAGDSVSVSVREGDVLFSAFADDREHLATAGQALEIAEDGQLNIEPIATSGQQWAWTEALAPGFQPEGHSLADVLDWAGRQTGRQVEYASPEAQRVAMSTEMHGAPELQAATALTVVSATSDLSASIEGSQILVELRP